jgi:7,8-dihydropterin-6-yl-methyl-4-(beta-D-ribofuranosyl)aminobenzene 5'-phosphate synthase
VAFNALFVPNAIGTDAADISILLQEKEETMEVAICTLVENTAQGRGILAEHGLSLLVESGEGIVLFDTGQGMVLDSNAAAMEIGLERVERIVLSHGHFDHTGGLRQVLDRIGPREVLAHPEALVPKYSVHEGNVREIGMPESRQILEQKGASFCLNEAPAEVVPGITATGRIPRVTDFEQVSSRFRTGPEDNLIQDMLWDDQALIVETGEGPVVVLGCAHAGLINTLLYAAELVGSKRFAGVIGGTHLVDAEPVRLQRTVDALRPFDIGRIAPCHCTGFRGQVTLWEAFGERFILNAAGERLEFGKGRG